uniref:Putative deoxyribonuclease TATDN2 n=2 Tax=Magallana TaxID=2171616 RepID=K1Q6T5_MAGGI
MPDGSSGMEVAEHSELPVVFDSHFHLDRTCKKIWGVEGGHTVEDLLKHSESDSVPYKPAIPVKVIGGIIVYSEPNTYPDVSFTLNGPWKVAVGVHPKQHSTFSEEKMMLLEQLLHHPKVVALGECGLDRSVPPSEWTQQEDVFIKLLKLAKPCIPIVLHLRGPAGDKYGSDVIARCMMLMEVHCRNAQRIHLHCFQGKTDVVKAWLKKFPNTCFGLTASVRTFDSHQIAGLKAIPRTNIVLETDAPYFPFGTAKKLEPSFTLIYKPSSQSSLLSPDELIPYSMMHWKNCFKDPRNPQTLEGFRQEASKAELGARLAAKPEVSDTQAVTNYTMLTAIQDLTRNVQALQTSAYPAKTPLPSITPNLW